MRAHDIINELERQYEVELDPNFEYGLCNDNTCHEECSCWDGFERRVEEQLRLQKYRGTLEVFELTTILDKQAGCEWPVFIDGRAIDEVWFNGKAFEITTKELETV